MMKKLLFGIVSVALVALSFAAPASWADEGKPSVIRLGFAGTGTGNRPLSGNNALATANLKGLMEEEFKKDGIKIDWSFYKFAGPAVNESFANNLIDFGFYGDFAAIIGKSAGLKIKLLAGGLLRQPVTIAVPFDSPVKTLADLKGKKLAVPKGTVLDLAISRVFAKEGLDLKSVRIVNILGVNATDALATKDLDGVAGVSYQFYPLRDRRVARIIYENHDADLVYSGGLFGTEDFIAKYPEITKRILKVYVKAAEYSSNEKNRNDLFTLWGQDGTGYGYYKEYYGKDALADHQSPLLDDYIVGRYKDAIADSLKFKLIRKDFDVNAWVDRSFLNAALKDLALENYWTPYGYDGKPLKP